MTNKTHLSGRAFLWLGIWQFVGTVSLVAKPALWLYLALFPILVWRLFLDRKGLPRREDWSVRFKGQPNIRLHETREWIWNIDLAARWKARLLRFHVPFLAIYTSDIDFANSSKYFRTEDVTQTVLGFRLGADTIRSVFLEIESPRSLWRQFLEVPIQPLLVHCQPSLASVPPEHLAPALIRLQHLFQGSRQLMKQRSRDQFHSVREFRSRDEIRDIDARKSAKSNQLMIREFDSLIQHHLVIGLDLGRSLSGVINESDKAHYYLEGIISLIQRALALNDRVSFFAFHQEVVLISKRIKSLRELRTILDLQKSFKAHDVESNYNLIAETLSAIDSQRCMVLILSDISRPSVQAEILDAMRPVARKHLALTMGILDKQSDFRQKESLRTTDLTEAWADDIHAYWLEDEFEKFSKRMTSIQSGAVLCPERYWLDMSAKLYGKLRDSLMSG